jgi:hypothetical protein
MSDERVLAKTQNVARASDDTWTAIRATRDGAPIIAPWLIALVIEGKGYNVPIGQLTSPVTGTVAITDTQSEAASEAETGYAVMPVRFSVDIEALVGTLPQVCFKSVGALITTIGTSQPGINLKIGGPAPSGRTGVNDAGGVVVAAEVATTTRVHFAATQAVAANNFLNVEFALPPLCVGPACFYLQVGSVGTGSTYFANYDYFEFAASEIS